MGEVVSCRCHACAVEDAEKRPLDKSRLLLGRIDPRLNRMFLCETCGNKRCPHAADHRLACSGSNEPGQEGSLYEEADLAEGCEAVQGEHADALEIGPGEGEAQP